MVLHGSSGSCSLSSQSLGWGVGFVYSRAHCTGWDLEALSSRKSELAAELGRDWAQSPEHLSIHLGSTLNPLLSGLLQKSPKLNQSWPAQPSLQ